MGSIGVRVSMELSDVESEDEARNIVGRLMRIDAHVIDFEIEDVEPLSGDMVAKEAEDAEGARSADESKESPSEGGDHPTRKSE